MNLIPNWRQAWRMLSVQAQALAVALLAGWQMLDADMRAAIPAWVVVVLACVILTGGIIGRLIAQPKVHDA